MSSSLRAVAERFMTDRCTIASATSVEFDADTEHDVETDGAELYDGKCQVRPVGADTVLEVGDAPLSIESIIVRLPVETVGISINDVVTVTRSDDPLMIGRALRVRAVLGGTGAASRNLYCEMVEPEGS